jgi:hypothetical protein
MFFGRYQRTLLSTKSEKLTIRIWPLAFLSRQWYSTLVFLALASGFLVRPARPTEPHDASLIQKKLRELSQCCPEEDFQVFVGRPDAVRAVKAMLMQANDEPHWYKAVIALGVIAPYDDETVRQLWDFLRSADSFASSSADRTSGPAPAAQAKIVISRDRALAKIEVPIAIGQLLSRSSDHQGKGLQKLIWGSDPKYWGSQIQWSGRSIVGDDKALDVWLATQSVRGLCLSHRAKAVEYVKDVLHANPPSTDRRYLDALSAACCAVPNCK